MFEFQIHSVELTVANRFPRDLYFCRRPFLFKLAFACNPPKVKTYFLTKIHQVLLQVFMMQLILLM